MAVDVIIVGGGAAGLSAALLLSRIGRSVILFNSGTWRNQWSEVHCLLGHDGEVSFDIIREGAYWAETYGTEIVNEQIVIARRNSDYNFEVNTNAGRRWIGRKLLLATGVKDIVPPVLQPYFGNGVYHCPYCDAWEYRNQRIAVYGPGNKIKKLADKLGQCVKDIAIIDDGNQIIKVVGDGDDRLHGVILETAEFVRCDALFLATGYEQQSDLALQLGCTLDEKGMIVNKIPGLFTAGDMNGNSHMTAIAMAEGIQAGIDIDKELENEKV